MAEFQHKLAYREKCKHCLLYGRFKPRSSSGTAVTPEGCDVSMLWMRGGMWRSRAAQYIYSRPSREVEALMDQLAASARRTCEEWPLEHPLYFAQAPIFCPRFIICPTLRATRAPWASRAGPPSNLGVELKADTSTFEYERHRSCLSVKTSTDEPSHAPLHARTLKCIALSS